MMVLTYSSARSRSVISFSSVAAMRDAQPALPASVRVRGDLGVMDARASPRRDAEIRPISSDADHLSARDLRQLKSSLRLPDSKQLIGQSRIGTLSMCPFLPGLPQTEPTPQFKERQDQQRQPDEPSNHQRDHEHADAGPCQRDHSSHLLEVDGEPPGRFWPMSATTSTSANPR